MTRWMVKALAVAPGLVVSTLVTSMVTALLPTPANAGVFVGGLSVTLLLLAGRGERAAARVLLLSRPARPDELRLLAPALTMLCRAGLGPPVIQLRVRDGVAPVAAGGMGRRTVAVSAGLLEAVADRVLPQQQAAAVIAHAAAITRDGWVRSDAAIAFWSLPWQVLQGVATAVASLGRRVPMTTLAWRMRAVVIGIAVVQNVQAAQPILAALVAAVGVLSYAVPHWQRQWQQTLITAGDQALVAAGFATPWAAFLRRCPPCPRLRERLRDLDPADPVRPQLGVVTAPERCRPSFRAAARVQGHVIRLARLGIAAKRRGQSRSAAVGMPGDTSSGGACRPLRCCAEPQAIVEAAILVMFPMERSAPAACVRPSWPADARPHRCVAQRPG